MSHYFEGSRTLPAYGVAGVWIMLLYAIQSEIRFGRKARSLSAGESDRGSTIAVTLAALASILGFALAMKAASFPWIPPWLRDATLPGMPAVAWLGVLFGAVGLVVRFWAVLTLRERYTRTLLTQDQQAVERASASRTRCCCRRSGKRTRRIGGKWRR